MKRGTWLLTALLGSLSFSAVAQQTMGEDPERTWAEDEQQPKTFSELDANSDGVLKQDEVQQGNFSGEFQELDRDSDDEVNRNEYYQYYRDQGGSNR